MAAANFEDNPYEQKSLVSQAAEMQEKYSTEDKEKLVQKLQKEMEKAAKNLDFLKAGYVFNSEIALGLFFSSCINSL